MLYQQREHMYHLGQLKCPKHFKMAKSLSNGMRYVQFVLLSWEKERAIERAKEDRREGENSPHWKPTFNARKKKIYISEEWHRWMNFVNAMQKPNSIFEFISIVLLLLMLLLFHESVIQAIKIAHLKKGFPRFNSYS